MYRNSQHIINQLNNNSSKLLDLSNLSIKKNELTTLFDHIKNIGFKGEIAWGKLPSRSTGLIQKIENFIYPDIEYKTIYPNDFICILLSLHAYSTPDIQESNVKMEDLPQYNHYLTNWQIIDKIDDQDSGYYGVMYQNITDQQLVLAHRGTQIEGQNLSQKLIGLFSNKDSDLQTDIKGIFGQEIVAQQVIAYKLTQIAVKYAKEKNYHLSVTGHSLGAWLAEMSGYYCHRDFDYHKVKIVNFDSPGSLDHMNKFDANIKNQETYVTLQNLDITTYLSAPNLVNSCNQHIGKVYRLFPKVANLAQLDARLLNLIYKLPILGQKIKDNSFLLDSLLSLSGHSLYKLAECFEPERGVPKKYMKVLHWPKIDYQPKKTISEIVIDNIAQNIPTSLMSSCFSSVAKNIVKKLSNNNTIFSSLNVISHFLMGNIDLSQYVNAYRHNVMVESDKNNQQIIEHNNFSIIYKNHYHLEEIDPYQEIIDTSNKGSVDWYLSRLAKSNKYRLKYKFSRQIYHALLKLKKQYKITVNNGKKNIYIPAKQETVSNIKDKLRYIISSYPEIATYLES